MTAIHAWLGGYERWVWGALGVFIALAAFRGFYTGRAPGLFYREGPARAEDPLGYWLNIVVNAVAALVLLCATLWPAASTP